MSRFASLDVGSNTVKLTIADLQSPGTWVPVVDVSRPTRLGEGIHARRLREAGVRRTLDALEEYAALCREHGVTSVAAVGTSALRDAVNRDDLLVRASGLGFDIEAIPGEEEARLSYLAVCRDPLWRGGGRPVVLDIGGGSTEVIVPREEGGVDRCSLQVGAVRLTEACLASDPPTAEEIAAAVALVDEQFGELSVDDWSGGVVGVGGTFANLAAVAEGHEEPRLEALHGRVLTAGEMDSQIGRYAAMDVEQRVTIPGLDPTRADIILGGALIARRFLHAIGAAELRVSLRGLRWGLLYDRFGSGL